MVALQSLVFTILSSDLNDEFVRFDTLVVVGREETEGGELLSNGIILEPGGPVSTVMYIVVSSISFPPPPVDMLNNVELRSQP
jgi:hypothetical protein